MEQIAIIGSGLAAVSAAKALIKRGVKPVILDYGDTLPSDVQTIVERMSKIESHLWSNTDKEKISANTTIGNKEDLPKKLAFSSDFFYGSINKLFNNVVQKNNPLPPFSLAYGGFANGWGGAALPADDCDLQSWPITSNDLQAYYEETLVDVPFSAVDDGLTHHFPLHSAHYNPLKLTPGNKALLSAFKKKANALEQMNAVAGQARLLTQAAKKDTSSCKYCGYCMSGCVYDSIYKPTNDLEDLIHKNLVEYRAGIFVDSLTEKKDYVSVHYTNKNKQQGTLNFKRVLVAAGAIGSTRIILQSKNRYDTEVPLLTTGSFIAPLLKLKGHKLDWPNSNTQPGIFLEYKVPDLSMHWVHVQLSTPNELVLQKLNLLHQKNTVFYKFKKYAAEHLFIAQCNMHSNHGVGHTLKLQKNNLLTSQYKDTEHAHQAVRLARKGLSRIARRVRCHVLSPFVQSGVGFSSNHLGGSLPMKHQPEEETDTNVLGNPKGWTRIHVIDSSIFPTIPGTTIGLLAMANAKRIVSHLATD
ncbi:hypothetical protein TUM19329_13340 [Legionella antarctica]|uniref:4Fe-4S ferredoxin-type domain-containing protein n=1 Tax=Legionella antarctica TaxID=2708020 RepID=A0A6F8T441_9GAMM|nr:GMC oxidoreductase [Legionella antarctica]BCA94973.1 hypothetical protein TUM19329_13340 [Legionella antarctica]